MRSRPPGAAGSSTRASRWHSPSGTRRSACAEPRASMATAAGDVPSKARASDERAGSSATVSVTSPGAAPASRRSSAAKVGPRNGVSASPRPSSSATTAGSTPDARLSPPSTAVRSSHHPDAATAASSVAIRAASPIWPTARGASRSTTWAAESRRACCSWDRRTSISRGARVSRASASTGRAACDAAPSPTGGAGSRRR